MVIDSYKAIDWYVDDPLEVVGNPGDIAVRLETQGVAISAFTEDGCIGCGGLLMWTPTEAEVWIRISKKGLKYKRDGIKAIKEGLRILIDTSPSSVHVFCWVDTEWPIAQRMVSWLGFTKGEETRIKDDKTYLIWEFAHGNGDDDNRDSCVSSRINTAECDDKATGRGTS